MRRFHNDRLGRRHSDLRERQLKLKQTRAKHLSLQLELQESLARSKERLARLLSIESAENEIEEISTRESEESHQLAPESTMVHSVVPQTAQIKSASALKFPRIDLEPQSEPKRHPACLLWVPNVQNKELEWTVPDAPGAQIIERIMLLFTREANAMDESTERESLSTNHRREMLWNTCLDFVLLSPLSETHQCDEQNLNLPDLKFHFGSLDPNVSLCPYELSGVCADIFCPYQHISKDTILPRERLPLPPLKATLGLSDKLVYQRKDEPISNKTIFQDDANHNRKESQGMMSSSESNPRKICAAGPCEGLVSLGRNGRDASKVTGEETNSLTGRASTDVIDDYISLPVEDDASSDRECEESLLEGDGEDVFVSHFLTSTLRTVPFWWDKEGQYTIFDEEWGFTSWLKDMTVFRIGDDRSFQSLPEGGDDFLLMVGRIVDATRVSLHAGRLDFVRSLQNNICNLKSHGNADLVAIQEELKSQIAKLLHHIAESDFVTNRRTSIFRLAFTRQAALGIISEVLHTVRMQCEGPTIAGSVALESVQSLVFTMLKENETVTMKDRVSYRSVLEGFRSELYRSFRVDDSCDTEASSVFDEKNKMFEVLRSNVTWGLRIFDNNDESLSLHRVDNLILKPCWSLASRFLRRSVNRDRPFECFRVALLMGFIVLGVLEEFSKQVRREEDCLIPSKAASLTTVDSTIHRLLFDFSTLVRDIPLLDLILSPIYALSVSTAAFLRFYSTAQHRLEYFLGARHGLVVTQEKHSLSRYSELLWSQLIQLRMSLPCETTREQRDLSKSEYSWEPSHEVIKSHREVANWLGENGICLCHLSLKGGINCVYASREAANMMEVASEITKESVHKLSQSSLLRSGGAENEVQLLGLCLANQEDQHGRIPSPSTSTFPQTIMLGGQGLTELKVVNCSLASLPHSFGLYFPNLKVRFFLPYTT